MKYNKLLTNEDREKYKNLIEKMKELCPEMMARKIPEANVQQAFMLDVIGKEIEKRFNTEILCVGSFEDTASACLDAKGIYHIKIDPDVNNLDLHTFKESYEGFFDIIFSTSVLEHVKNDVEFIGDMCSLLKSDGLGVITCDFNNSYKLGDKLPYSDERFYTKKDFSKFRKIIKEYYCKLVDRGEWDGEPDFTHDGCNYSFATFVFRKE